MGYKLDFMSRIYCMEVVDLAIFIGSGALLAEWNERNIKVLKTSKKQQEIEIGV